MLGRADRDQFGRIWQRKLAADPQSEYRPGANRRIDRAINLLSGGKRLLDIGCGAGILLAQVRGRYGQVCGIDISRVAVAAARRKGIRARVVNLNSERLPYPDRHFDAATILSALQYVYDPERMLLECRRVLRPGGTLILSVPNIRAFWRLARLLVQGWFPPSSLDPEGYDGGTLHYFAFRNVKGLLEDSGFRVKAADGIFCIPRFAERLPSRGPVGALKREFLAAETFILAEKTTGASA